MVLVAGRGAGGEVAGLSRLQSKLVMVVVAVLLVFLWIASVASELD